MNEQMEQLLELINSKQFRQVKIQMTRVNEADIAELIGELDAEKKVVVFRMLPKEVSSG